MSADYNNSSIEQILSRTSAAEFRNSCNDSIRSTSSPATDIYDRESDVYSLLPQHNDLLENEAPMEDETTIQEISGTSEEELEQITRPPQPVSESVLVSDEYSADILAHVKRTEVRLDVTLSSAPNNGQEFWSAAPLNESMNKYDIYIFS